MLDFPPERTVRYGRGSGIHERVDAGSEAGKTQNTFGFQNEQILTLFIPLTLCKK